MLGEELQMGVDRTLSHQADSAMYLINEHSQYETANLPVDQNILDFSQRQMDFKFKVTLFCDTEDCKNLSKELKSKLVVYYIFYTGALAIKLMTEILFNSEYTVPWSHMLFHILSCACLFCISMVVLFCVCVSGVALTFNRELYTLLSLLTIIYYCLGEESILSGITSNSFNHQFPNGVIYIVALISVTKALIFNCFKYVTFLSIFGSLFYLTIGLIFTKASYYTIVCDFFIMLLLLSLQTFDSHQIDYRTRQLFYRKLQEEEALMPLTSYANRGVRTTNNVNSEVEQIVKCCDHIKSHIKNAAQIIMFNDVKKNLKEAANDIEKIKRRVAHGSFLADIKIEPSYEIDEEDRVFLTQMFSELKTPTPRRSRRPSIQQMLERVCTFPFADYGVAELENVLSGMGKNWSFDIWFVYNATGHSIIIVADFLFQKWGLKNEFRIKEEIIKNYFKSLENVRTN